ncbi:unnamed protein product [Caenorhabditis brenneri]
MVRGILKPVSKNNSFSTERRITRLQAKLDPSLAPQPIPSSPAPIREPPKWMVVAMKELASREPKKGTSTKKLSEMVKNSSKEQRDRWKELAKRQEKK